MKDPKLIYHFETGIQVQEEISDLPDDDYSRVISYITWLEENYEKNNK